MGSHSMHVKDLMQRSIVVDPNKAVSKHLLNIVRDLEERRYMNKEDSNVFRKKMMEYVKNTTNFEMAVFTKYAREWLKLHLKVKQLNFFIADLKTTIAEPDNFFPSNPIGTIRITNIQFFVQNRHDFEQWHEEFVLYITFDRLQLRTSQVLQKSFNPQTKIMTLSTEKDKPFTLYVVRRKQHVHFSLAYFRAKKSPGAARTLDQPTIAYQILLNPWNKFLNRQIWSPMKPSPYVRMDVPALDIKVISDCLGEKDFAPYRPKSKENA